MTRYRWYHANWPVGIRGLSDRFRRYPYVEGADEGFIMERVRSDRLEAAYFQRVILTDVASDPFGKQTESERVTFNRVRFSVSTGPLSLEIPDAGKGLQSFAAKLVEICDFDLSIRPVNVDLLDWSRHLAKNLPWPTYVDALQIGKVELDAGIVARVIIKGRSEVRRAADRFLTHGAVPEKLQLRLMGEVKGTVVLSAGGAASLNIQRETEVVDAARRTLADLVERGSETSRSA